MSELSTSHTRIIKNRSQKKIYDARKAAGLCTWCGERPPTRGLKCDACCDLQNARTARSRVRKASRGCFRCGLPQVADTKACAGCLERERERDRRRKKEIVAAYGGLCQCCGEDDVRLLTIDHVRGGGNQHRRSLSGGKCFAGRKFYSWLRRNGFPAEYQILCWNCNVGRAMNGGTCPHRDRPVPGLVISAL